MRALIKNIDGISLQDLQLIKTNDILVKVDTVGLCRTDLLVGRNKIPTQQKELVLGHEFSAHIEHDPSGKFMKGQFVGVNPLWNEGFMGLDFDGALCEFIYVPEDKIIPTSSTDSKLIAYLEPVAASMAVLKILNDKNAKIAIIGHNRIAQLTKIILVSEGFEIDYLNENETIESEVYDYIIETVFEEQVIKNAVKGLKKNGTLIVKSRKKFPVNILAADLVEKEISLRAVNYYDFHETMRWLEKNSDLVQGLLGDTYCLEEWEKAFDVAETDEKKKIFIKV